MFSSSRAIYQNLLDSGNDGRLEVTFVKISNLNDDDALRSFVERNDGRPLGLSGAYLPRGTLQVLAIADATSVICIDFGDKNNGRSSNNSSNSSLTTTGRDYLCNHVLERTCGFLYAFDMAPLALALWQGHDLRIKQAIDLQSAGPPKTRAPHATIALAIANTPIEINKDNIIRTFDAFICEQPSASAGTSVTTPLAQRAWAAHYVAQLAFMEDRLFQVPPIDTFKLSDALLHFLSKSTMDAFQKDHAEATEVTRSYTTKFDVGKKQLDAKADRFQNRIRKGKNQQAFIHVLAHDGTGAFTLPANVAGTDGGSTQLGANRSLGGRLVTSITLMGKGDPTAAEVKRAHIILLALQGKLDLTSDFNPWIHQIYLDPGEDFMWPAEWSEPAPTPVKLNPDKIPRPLNSSQRKAIRCMLDQTDSTRITIIQGPPGTGKTTVIASYVLTATSAGRSGIWLIAQSNVAVKNIAEKLANFGLANWKLLVSNDFYEFWHEHLYTSIKSNIITSEEFCHRLSELNVNCPVVLCTLSMLSNDMLRIQGVFRRVPVYSLVIDEASQIEIGDYIPLFTNFNTIRKAIFIGDNLQLPPHGQDSNQELQSIFEVKHLASQDSTNGSKKSFIFLDTQYRMPPQIGDFIAQTVYPAGDEDATPLLKSSDQHPLANITESLLCHFVNVPGEQMSNGTSWKNLEESKAIVKLASLFQAQKKKFRIITPYDAQRTLIEKGLQEAELEWGDKCFNVDSFQGNEEDYIIISLVRSSDLGFLDDKRRMNVMLSRCKRGMVIFTNKAYIKKFAGPGKTLIGELADSWYSGEAWIEVGDLETTDFV